MSDEEIKKALHNGERICARLFVRPDGKHMTKSCREKSKRYKILKWIGIAALMPISLALFRNDSYENSIDKLRNVPLIGEIVNKLHPKPQPQVYVGQVMAKGLWALVVGETKTDGEYHTIHKFQNNNGTTSWRPSHPHPIFSHDGKRIYFNVSEDGFTRLYVASVENQLK